MTPGGDRLESLDTIRGVAVLGILLLNIVGFGMPEAAYFNPRAYGGWHGTDLAVWLVNFILFDGKMRGLFSFLFGASMLLVIERASASGENATAVHFSRMGWLLIFGLAHLYLVWDGDILTHYALVGMIAWFSRKMPVPNLLALGIVLLLFETISMALLPLGLWQAMAPGAPDAAAAARTVAEYRNGFGMPPATEITRELALFRGSYAGLLGFRLGHSTPLGVLRLYGPETLAYMLFGMAALRSGLLGGEWARADYRRWMRIGFAIGIPAYAAIAGYMVWRGFDLFAVMLGALVLTIPVRPLMILSWACLILLAMRPGGALTARLAAAGRMAFTNYLATSLICTTFFYGYGLGWFGMLSRTGLYAVVFAVWAAMLLWSKPWLARFRYGPLEWLWRSLARRRPQPIFIANATQ